jgi:regulator of sigma E protease
MFDWLLQNNELAAIIAFALVLVPVIIIHELGHFVAGRSVGVTILEFGIGFPPRIGKMFTLWGTEFTLNVLPFGGFVRPLGEDLVSQQGDESANQEREEAEKRGLENIKAVGDAKPLERIWFLSAGAIFNVATAFVVFIIIGLVGIPGEHLQVIVVEDNSPLRRAGVQTNDVISSVDGRRFAISEDFFEQLSNADAAPSFTILRGEEGVEVKGTLDSVPTFSSAIDNVAVYIVGVAERSPAEASGMEVGDVITQFNNEPINSLQELISLTGENLDQTVSIVVQRGGEIVELELVPRGNPPEGEGAMGIVIDAALYNADAGLFYRPLPNQAIVSLSFVDAVNYSFARFNSIFTSIAAIPSQITSGQITAAEARPVSIVGISQVGGYFLQESIEQQRPIEILNYVAIISIALGFTNLLPLPALDGGRILFVFIEIVRGKPIPPERESVVHLLGLAFLLSLTVVIVINDIINPVTDLIR